jgi:hypothetical protein
VTFRQIGQIALDGVEAGLLARMKRAVEGSADEALTLRSTAGEGATAKTLREGHAWPSMQRVEGADAAMRIKDGEATDVDPTQLLPPWMAQERHGRVTMHGRAVTAATGSPIPIARPYLVTLNGKRVDHASAFSGAR